MPRLGRWVASTSSILEASHHHGWSTASLRRPCCEGAQQARGGVVGDQTDVGPQGTHLNLPAQPSHQLDAAEGATPSESMWIRRTSSQALPEIQPQKYGRVWISDALSHNTLGWFVVQEKTKAGRVAQSLTSQEELPKPLSVPPQTQIPSCQLQSVSYSSCWCSKSLWAP